MPDELQSDDKGNDRQFSVKLPASLVDELDEIAGAQHISRNAVVRQLVDLGMEQRRRQLAAIQAVA